MINVERISKIRRRLKNLKLDALLVSNPSNIFYLSGFSGHDSVLLVTQEENYIVTDFRFEQDAKKSASGFEIIAQPGNLYQKISRIIRRLSLKRVGFESGHMTVRGAEFLTNLIAARLVPFFGLIESLRVIKYPDEISAIKTSACIAKNVLKIIIKEVKNNRTEKDIAVRIDFLLRKEGADSTSFDTIVASGENASMPHARPSNKKIRPGEAVVLDFGARRNNYTSDLTRTLFVGKISKQLSLVYSIVAAAQKKAINKIAPGVKISEIDRVARDYITKKGFGNYFGHATGHCVGIDVHELPSINSKNHTTLKEGMVFTVEPGIYMPGIGGVRIEDMVLVNKNGYEVLTR